MDCFISIDSGGTKTKAVLTDTYGHILSQIRTSGCNPLDVGVDAACDTIISCVSELTQGKDGTVVSIYAGIAGVNHVDIGLEDKLRAIFQDAVIRVEDDRRIVLSGTVGHTNGCGMICGTGSSLSIVKENEPILQIGGLGYLIDTCGSGYELGQAALKRAFRYLDGRDEYTVLPELLSRCIGKTLRTAMFEIYSGGRAYIASLAHTVFEAAELGDIAANEILDTASSQLAELTYAAEKHFEGDFPVVMTGGIFSSYPAYCQSVMAKSSARAKMQTANVPPIYGALVEAMWQSGIEASEETKAAFMRDYI